MEATVAEGREVDIQEEVVVIHAVPHGVTPDVVALADPSNNNNNNNSNKSRKTAL